MFATLKKHVVPKVWEMSVNDKVAKMHQYSCLFELNGCSGQQSVISLTVLRYCYGLNVVYEFTYATTVRCLAER